MWYGVLGTKELLHRTYRNLEQKVLLEVSGSLLGDLPSLAIDIPVGLPEELLPRPRSPASAGEGLVHAEYCSFLSTFLWLSVMGARFPSRVFRELLFSTFPAMPEGPTSGGAPRKMMYVWALRWVGWA